MSFNVDFLGKNLLLSEECKNVLGATRNMQIYEIDLINVFYNELLNSFFNSSNLTKGELLSLPFTK